MDSRYKRSQLGLRVLKSDYLTISILQCHDKTYLWEGLVCLGAVTFDYSWNRVQQYFEISPETPPLDVFEI
jgi:hypothetical protein